ncbi:MAG: helix-turn-helix transcriptional regulator [Actinocatenispora sp.]
MSMAADGPRFSRLRVGEEIRRMRIAHNLSQVQLGTKIGSSGARVSRLETGETAPDLAMVMNLLDFFEVSDSEQKRIISLARLANEHSWWKVSGMQTRQAAFAELESTAVGISEYSMVFVPGLLQTPEYAKIRYSDTEGQLPFDMEAALTGRQERQQILTRSKRPVRYEVILDELVLHRATAPDNVMVQQRQHLVEMAKQSNVEVRVLPLGAKIGYHTPSLNSFALYTFAGLPEIGVVETETTEAQTNDDDQLERYRHLVKRLRAAALEPDESIKLIEGGTG